MAKRNNTASPKPTRTPRSRKPGIPEMKWATPPRWQSEVSSILCTAQHVANGLLKLKARQDIPETLVNVAALLLMRLDDMRTDTHERARLAQRALEAGDVTRALWELTAIQTGSEAQRDGGYHGVRITTDMAFYGSRLTA